MKLSNKSDHLDKLGMSASIACAIHCAAVPVFITFLPLWGLGFLANPTVELLMILLSICLASIALSKSFRAHRKIQPIIVLLIGFACIILGHFLIESLEAVLVPLGGFTIATGHFLNMRYTRICAHHIKDDLA
ncbi:energy-coupling factor transporter transmembrane protein EcfT [Pedobacter sp. UYP24]